MRFIIPFIAGIILQDICSLPIYYISLSLAIALSLLLAFTLLPLRFKYRFQIATALFFHVALVSLGALLLYYQQLTNDKHWFGHTYATNDYLTVIIQEPLVEKSNSYKALASVTEVYKKEKNASGKIIIYFKKDSINHQLRYGSEILIHKALQSIRNNGNPGSFDYKTWCFRQGITHQVYLTENDYLLLPGNKANGFRKFTYAARQAIVDILKKYIPEPREQGLIEAMLIGYKDDLDKTLSQSYTNTGVIHLIAISGLHLALIYGLLLFLTQPLKKIRQLHVVRILIIIAALWLFSILAGAQASVMRSAVMFTCIILAELLNRRSSIYNTLALSAFLLLCYDPYWLWDIGFQLSYLAVLSILLFLAPIRRLLYFPNPALSYIWQLMAVTLSAQILTTPVSIYYFHQFPNLFLITNMVAVPLSGLVLYGAILLCSVSFIPNLAKYAGIGEEWMIRMLNNYIQWLDQSSIALWERLTISFLQMLLLYGFIAAITYLFWNKRKRAIWAALGSLLLFSILHVADVLQAEKQQQIIVYNIPKHPAIEAVEGSKSILFTDSAVLENQSLDQYYLKPSRLLNHIRNTTAVTAGCAFSFHKKNIVWVNRSNCHIQKGRIIDLLILSGNPKIYLNQFLQSLQVKKIIIDGSVPPWKSRYWKRDCDSLHISYYDVSENGAFVMNL